MNSSEIEQYAMTFEEKLRAYAVDVILDTYICVKSGDSLDRRFRIPVFGMPNEKSVEEKYETKKLRLYNVQDYLKTQAAIKAQLEEEKLNQLKTDGHDHKRKRRSNLVLYPDGTILRHTKYMEGKGYYLIEEKWGQVNEVINYFQEKTLSMKEYMEFLLTRYAMEMKEGTGESPEAKCVHVIEQMDIKNILFTKEVLERLFLEILYVNKEAGICMGFPKFDREYIWFISGDEIYRLYSSTAGPTTYITSLDGQKNMTLLHAFDLFRVVAHFQEHSVIRHDELPDMSPELFCRFMEYIIETYQDMGNAGYEAGELWQQQWEDSKIRTEQK